MKNITEYLKEKEIYDSKIIHRFLRTERVKYFIGHEEKVVSKRGRYGSFTLFSEDLFELFLLWRERKPLPLLNRKEYEISIFIKSYFNDSIKQYKIGSYIYDWYCPSHNLLIEFNESHHRKKTIIDIDNKKSKLTNNIDIFYINENTVMQDLALLVKNYRGN